MTQSFKGDSLEIKMQTVGGSVFDQTDTDLDAFYAGAYDCDPFLLMLYDEGRMPFSDRVNRDTFVSFIREALRTFTFTGTFETFLFILRSIFGSDSEILFTIPDPGKLSISINASSNLLFDFIGREFVDGAYETFEIIDDVGNVLTFRGIPGIDTEYQLTLLFSEMIPAGITPTFQIQFISVYDFIAEYSSDEYDVITSIGDQIIFWEIGG